MNTIVLQINKYFNFLEQHLSNHMYVLIAIDTMQIYSYLYTARLRLERKLAL